MNFRVIDGGATGPSEPVDIAYHICHACGKRMRLKRIVAGRNQLLRCAGSCGVELIICIPSSIEMHPRQAFWNRECPHGVDIVMHARNSLGEYAPAYGFPVAVPK